VVIVDRPLDEFDLLVDAAELLEVAIVKVDDEYLGHCFSSFVLIYL